MERPRRIASVDPSPFILHWLPRVRRALGARPRALDVAMGQGRHLSALVRTGFRAFGVDRDQARVRQAHVDLLACGLVGGLWVADLERQLLGDATFDVVLCTRYLQRSLWPTLANAVGPGGFILYETFTTDQLQYDWGPRSSDHLLRTGGELRAAFPGWDMWVYEECAYPVGEARLVASKPDVPRG